VQSITFLVELQTQNVEIPDSFRSLTDCVSDHISIAESVSGNNGVSDMIIYAVSGVGNGRYSTLGTVSGTVAYIIFR
jgi:hypothetical protein